MKIDYAKNCDFESWISLLELVKESFPGLDLGEYRNVLHQSILNQEALIAKDDKGKLVGELIFSRKNYELAFLAIHPSYRKKGIATNLIHHMFNLIPKGTKLKVITYRKGDVKGIAARKLYDSIGFTEGKLITVFNYPCQELNYVV
ncbi:GNAT family N-acetyltransferase [Clostridium sp. JS66]|uniref:GNAT family N-acetyltransferase n=1 Tax=Clostridium sp. JS66 TaxID=3064705 RepID=UPI00298EC6C4|nr:GNAT family N-acetyltransferase [Clostridium sp. JS66]WPC39901.1 GNAT family N-acetyltransferase [Clostridium sp. JS66]